VLIYRVVQSNGKLFYEGVCRVEIDLVRIFSLMELKTEHSGTAEGILATGVSYNKVMCNVLILDAIHSQ
jgi:hypothetical protein